MERFCAAMLEAALPHVVAVKPNLAFFEQHGAAGLAVLERVRGMVPESRLLILDAKRGDIGSTAEAQARALFDVWGADAVTVNPLLGQDAVAPFLARPGTAALILARTSNPGAADFLEAPLQDGRPLYRHDRGAGSHLVGRGRDRLRGRGHRRPRRRRGEASRPVRPAAPSRGRSPGRGPGGRGERGPRRRRAAGSWCPSRGGSPAPPTPARRRPHLCRRIEAVRARGAAAVSARAVIELSGHIIDSMLLPRVMDSVMDMGATFHVEEFRVGTRLDEPSFARLTIEADTEERLAAVVAACQQHGAAVVGAEDAATEPAPSDGVFPDTFYTTTNQPTSVRVAGGWVEVRGDRDGLRGGGRRRRGPGGPGQRRARRRGRWWWAGPGVRIVAGGAGRGKEVFGFTTSSLSPEKPKHQVIRELAGTMREIRARDGRICFVGGPGIIHTGAGPHLAQPDRPATCRCSSPATGWPPTTSSPSSSAPRSGSAWRRACPSSRATSCTCGRSTGSAPRAASGPRWRRGCSAAGVMYECVRNGVEYVLAGSIRDDGPLPDVVTDMLEARRRMRTALAGVDLCIMCASMLHAIATGNLLPAATRTVCVDINPAVVAKLADRGSSQTLGLVTDVESFLRELGEALAVEPA